MVYVRSDMEELKEVCKSKSLWPEHKSWFHYLLPSWVPYHVHHKQVGNVALNFARIWSVTCTCTFMCIFFIRLLNNQLGSIVIEFPSILLIVFVHFSSHYSTIRLGWPSSSCWSSFLLSPFITFSYWLLIGLCHCYHLHHEHHVNHTCPPFFSMIIKTNIIFRSLAFLPFATY